MLELPRTFSNKDNLSRREKPSCWMQRYNLCCMSWEPTCFRRENSSVKCPYRSKSLLLVSFKNLFQEEKTFKLYGFQRGGCSFLKYVTKAAENRQKCKLFLVWSQRREKSRCMFSICGPKRNGDTFNWAMFKKNSRFVQYYYLTPFSHCSSFMFYCKYAEGFLTPCHAK